MSMPIASTGPAASARRSIERSHEGDRLGVVLQDHTYPTALAAVDPEHAHQRALAASISSSFTTARSSRASAAPGPLRMRLQ